MPKVHVVGKGGSSDGNEGTVVAVEIGQEALVTVGVAGFSVSYQVLLPACGIVAVGEVNAFLNRPAEAVSACPVMQ